MRHAARRSLPYAWVLALAACGPDPATPTITPSEGAAPAAGPTASAIEVYDGLEAKIEAGTDREQDRQDALKQVRAIPDDGSAEYAFVRAAITGRTAELRGVKAGKLVTEAEAWARKSIERDPAYRDEAASRMLGSLWVMAPARLVEHGDSEEGLELLETLAQEHPDVVVNHLRVAEAFVFLGDPDPAVPYLCRVREGIDALRRDDRALYDRLVADVADGEELSCAGASD